MADGCPPLEADCLVQGNAVEMRTAAQTDLSGIEVRKYTPKSRRRYRTGLNLFLRFCLGAHGARELAAGKTKDSVNWIRQLDNPWRILL